MPPWTKPAVSVLALGLAACTTVGPDFKTPAPPQGAAAAGYAMAGDLGPSSLTLSPAAQRTGPWWQAFGSPELDALVRQALADSPSVAEAKATLEAAQADLAAVRGEQSPQLGLNANAQRERINTQSFGFTGFPSPTINLYSVGATVSYDLDLFGGRERRTEAAQARVEAEQRRADAAYLSLSGNVVYQALTIASLQAQIAAVEQVIADDRRTLDMIHASYDIGQVPPSSLSVGNADLANDRALIPPLTRKLDVARHQLALLVGRSPAEWTAPNFRTTALTIPVEVPLKLPSELVRQRPDILAAEAELHAATAEVGVAIANQYPNLDLSAGFAQTALTPSTLFNYASSGWHVLGGVTAPLLDGGTLKARRRGAEADARVAVARYQQTVLRAFVQVSDVLSDLGSDDRSIAALSDAVTAADHSRRDAENLLRLGGDTQLHLVDTQRRANRARRVLVEAQGQRALDLVRLYIATAADWRTAN